MGPCLSKYPLGSWDIIPILLGPTLFGRLNRGILAISLLDIARVVDHRKANMRLSKEEERGRSTRRSSDLFGIGNSWYRAWFVVVDRVCGNGRWDTLFVPTINDKGAHDKEPDTEVMISS